MHTDTQSAFGNISVDTPPVLKAIILVRLCNVDLLITNNVVPCILNVIGHRGIYGFKET